ncbi:MAG TPA: acyl-CoA carboxylase subunit beta [Polyangiaceae bacterium]|nr:acyl-CoA carboxylase subunit beta [Polyangiaceae bacterium]
MTDLSLVKKRDSLSGDSQDGEGVARSRLELLFDAGSFEELDAQVVHRTESFGMGKKRPAGDGVITGVGRIGGRSAFAFSQDRGVLGGSLGEAHARKICKVQDLAVRNGSPLVGICDSGGARIQEGVDSLGGYGEIFFRNVRASGVVPQVSLVLGPSAGGAVYSPALTDFVIMSEGQSYMFLTGPKVVKTVTFEDIDTENLGGARVHAERSGVAHFAARHDAEAIAIARRILSYLPDNCQVEPPVADCDDPPDRLCEGIDGLVPGDPRQPYDIRTIIGAVMDRDSFLEVHERFAGNVVVGFARLAGHPVGIVANQPAVLAGCLDINSSRKAGRFIRTCNAFRLPIISFVDVPGFLPGSDQEYGAVISHGAKLLYAYCESSVPKLSVILRKAYGGAYIVMGSKHIGGDVCLAWPSAEIAVMGGAGAVEILYRREIAAAADPKAEIARLQAEYAEQFLSPRQAAERGFVDAIISPDETRRKLSRMLGAIAHRRDLSWAKRNGNIPL